MGDSEVLKTWAALYACREFVVNGRQVLYIDCEGALLPTVYNLKKLGLSREAASNFSYWRLEDKVTLEQLTHWLSLIGPTLMVVDGVTELLSLYGWDPNKNTDVSAYQRLFLKHTNLTTIELDHTTKYAAVQTGSIHKRAGMNGASYLLESVDRGGVGGVSTSRVKVLKDRVGMVRPYTEKDLVGYIRLDSSNDELWQLEFLQKIPGYQFLGGLGEPMEDLEEKIVTAVGMGAIGYTEVSERAGIGVDKTRRLIRELLERGRLERNHAGHLVIPEGLGEEEQW